MHPSEFALRALGSTALVAAAFIGFGETMMHALLPTLRQLLEMVDRHHSVLDLRIVRSGADTVLQLEAGIREMILTDLHVTFADPRARATVSTPIAAFWIAPGIVLASAIGWPVQRLTEYPLRLVASLIACSMLWAIDTPLALDGHLWDLHRDAHAPHTTSPLLMWHYFLMHGGRYLTGGAAATIVIGLAASAGRSRILRTPRGQARPPEQGER